MLEVAAATDDDALEARARGVLDVLAARRVETGSFTHMGFVDGAPAFTHTIAYTIRGFIEAARLTGSWHPYGSAAAQALEILLRKAELNGGRLPGAFDTSWRSAKRYVCLTGNAQTALVLLKWENHESDLRIVNGAAKLVDTVNRSQKLHRAPSGVRGAVAGSSPLFGRYMRLRYPNWAAKFHVDAILALMRRIRQEKRRRE
jgi:hypothetical protein